MLSLVKIFEFAYGHHLPGYDGKCVNPHGHTGVMHVEICQPKEDFLFFGKPPRGMIMDFAEFKKAVNSLVIDNLDHHYLNDFMEMPTAENMTEWAVEQLKKYFGDCLLRVRIYETPTSYAEWRAE